MLMYICKHINIDISENTGTHRKNKLHLSSTCSVPGNILGPLHALTYACNLCINFTTTLLKRYYDFYP